MDFVSIRVITEDVARLAGFYEKATGVRATWYNEDFAELGTDHATLAIGSTRTVPLFAPGAARPTDNRTVIIEFPSRESAEGWYKSADYQKIIGLRLKSTSGNLVILDGA